MFAALITGRHQLELVEFPDPTPADRGVVVDIALCGICGTDIHAYQSGQPYNPAICGHEWAGTISATGRDVKDLSEGDRVVVAVAPACVPRRAATARRWATTARTACATRRCTSCATSKRASQKRQKPEKMKELCLRKTNFLVSCNPDNEYDVHSCPTTSAAV